MQDMRYNNWYIRSLEIKFSLLYEYQICWLYGAQCMWDKTWYYLIYFIYVLRGFTSSMLYEGTFYIQGVWKSLFNLQCGCGMSILASFMFWIFYFNPPRCVAQVWLGPLLLPKAYGPNYTRDCGRKCFRFGIHFFHAWSPLS